jgi:hypothetical protein
MLSGTSAAQQHSETARLTAPPAGRPQRVRLTMRQDAWWLPSLLTFLGLSTFLVYATWAAFQNAHYAFGNYLSPMYSPELFGASPHAWFGPKPDWYPSFLPFSPALLILWAPGGFRFTCYYYRGAYYKAFWADPPGCAVGEPRKSYWGENSFPLIVQNIHRYFLYLALLFLVFLSYDVYRALWFADPVTGVEQLGLGVGTLVLALNTSLLASYTLGCHSLRHLVGGSKDELGKEPMRAACYQCAGKFNRWHMRWAWASLFGVMFADLYVRMCAMGLWTDWRIV